MIGIGTGGILRPAIRVADEAGRWTLLLSGHHHGSEWQFGSHMVTHPLRSLSNDATHRRTLGLLRPSDDLAGCQVEHRSQIQPAFAGCDAGNGYLRKQLIHGARAAMPHLPA